MTASSTAGRLGRRLSRILVLLPYAIRHPGVTLDELSLKFAVSKRDIIGDLELVFLCGLPGYGPGDLIDVSIDDDRVFVRMADYFAAPLRLAPAEALALYAAGHALASLPELEEADALKRALAKLGRALGVDGAADAVHLRLQPGPAEHLARVRRALNERRRLELEYLSASRGSLTVREVDPWALIVAWGRSYLVGWDHLSGEERMFRIDRIKVATVTDAPAEVPADFDPEPYRRAFVDRGEERTVTLEISPAVARWFTDYYPVRSASPCADSWQRVELASNSDMWVATLLLRLGSEVRSVQPDAIVDRARELAASIARRHEGDAGAP